MCAARLHSLPNFHRRFGDAGSPPFLSPKALNLIAIDWQKGLLDRLNDEVRGTELEMASIPNTILAASKDRSKILTFNYASKALNNSFFLNGLKLANAKVQKETGPQSRYGERAFELALQASPYRNLSNLQSAFSAAALGMASSGFLWLARDHHGKLGIVPTYGAGTIMLQAQTERGIGGGISSQQSRFTSAEAEAEEFEAEERERERRGNAGAGKVTPSAGQSSSAAQQGNVGAALGRGVQDASANASPSFSAGAPQDANAGGVSPAAGQSHSAVQDGNVGATVGGGVASPSPSASSQGNATGGVTPSAGQTSSATEKDNVGATVGGGVQPIPSTTASASSHDQPSAQVPDDEGANNIVPPATGSSVSPAAKGNVGGTMGGGVGSSSRSFSTSALAQADSSGNNSGGSSGRVFDALFRRNPASGGGGGGAGSGPGASAGRVIGSEQTSATPTMMRNTQLYSRQPPPNYSNISSSGSSGSPISSALGSASSALTGGYGPASPIGPGFRRKVARQDLDMYEADAGETLFPLLCLSVHEHAWMTDYGLWGKEEYLRNFWEAVDWGVVRHLYQSYEYYY